MSYSIEQVQKLLQELRDKDQEILHSIPVNIKEFDALSKKACEVIKEIISEHGGITISKFGEKTSRNAWLLVQHMDWNVSFQEEYLYIMLDDFVDYYPANIAYLTDRVFVNKGKPQVYATQFQNFPKEGKYRPFPTINPKEVNERRAEVGLEPLEEYAKGWLTADLSDFYNQ